jgi:type IV pilus assembly protein PilY1
MERIMKNSTEIAQPLLTSHHVPGIAGHRRSKLWTACCLAGLAATSLTAQGSLLTLATAPAGTGGREPAPNVIVSVDDSGSMGDTGIATLKDALRQTFAASNVPDGRIRLAWQSMWDCRGIPNASVPCSGKNTMKRLQGTHRTNFMTWVDSLAHPGWTPSHLTMKAAGDYLSKPHADFSPRASSPWASDPGTTELPVLGCRRSYNIFMTDGEWNSLTGWGDSGSGVVTGGNADGTAITLPDGTPYPVTGDQTRATRDSYGSGTLSTLSDVAFYFWSRDLQLGIPNDITPKIKVPDDETVGTTVLTPYWNLKNNPATWQNMTTYTIGFNSAATLSGAPTWDSAAGTWGGTGYVGLVDGTTNWGNPINTGTANKAHELWHMALNSRGRFVPAPNAAALVTAFKDILDNIVADTAAPAVSIAANSSTLIAGSKAYLAGFNSADWSGQLKSYGVNTATGALVGYPGTPDWYASGLNAALTPVGLDAASFSVTSRLVLSHNASAGISWKWANLPTAQRTLMKTGGVTDTVGQNRVNYVRGDKTKEVSVGGTFRNRSSRLGDIVNSNILFTGKPSGGYTTNDYATFRTTNSSRAPMLYVGSNDGMLHGFQASDGVEKLAYVPRGLLSKFANFTNPSYSHEYFVEGQPFAGDAYLGATLKWQTLLVSGLGGGGKGYFVLNVTNPTNFTEANATTIVSIDKTDGADADLGHIYSPPVLDDSRFEKSSQVVKMNNNRWAVVMGNGYNSTNETPTLLIQYVDGDKALVKVTPTTCPATTCSGDGNGLSAPRLLDLDGDGDIDVAYAGDLKGNLWKFDLTAATDALSCGTCWRVAFSDAPFFVAGDPAGARQSITTAPYTMSHPRGGIMLAFGTGRNVTTTDPGSVGTDTMWGIYDNSTITISAGGVTITVPPDSVAGDFGPINSSVSGTRPISLVQHTTALAGTVDGKKFFNVSVQDDVVFTSLAATSKRGWYVDWPVAGLRVLHNPILFAGEKVWVQSTVPQSGTAATAETCTSSWVPESTYNAVFNMFTGNPPQTPAFETGLTSETIGIGESYPGDNLKYWGVGSKSLTTTTPGGPTTFRTGGGLGARSNWREFQ